MVGGLTVFIWPSLTPEPGWVGGLWWAFGLLALWMSRQRRAAHPAAVLGLASLMVLEVAGVILIQGWAIEGPGLPFMLIPLFAVGVLCRPADALALWGLSLICTFTLFILAPAQGVPPDPFHPSGLTRLAGLSLALTMATALGLTLGRALAAALQERERMFLRYRTLFNQVPAAVLLHRGDRLIDANDRAVRLLSAEGRRSLLAQPLSHWISPAFRAPFATRCEELDRLSATAGAAEMDFHLIDREGREHPVRATTARCSVDADAPLLTILSDERAHLALEASLRQAKEVAEATSRAKSNFVANTSHEIRTPLNGIIGLLNMVRDPATDEASRQRYLAMMADGAESLRGLLTDVLDLSKIEAGKLQISDEPLGLLSLIQTVADSHRVLAESKGLAFDLHCDIDANLWVLGDAQRVRQILVNLLHNALKFTASGRIRLSVSRRGDGLTRFEIEDTGIGIEAANQALLFQPFTQADESSSRSFGGTGLGLSICRRLVDLMGGRIGAYSRPGLGSRFWFELTLVPTHSPAPSPAARSASAVAVPPLTGRRILVVDDNPVNLLITGFVLERLAAEVSTAASGERALAAVAQAQQEGLPFDLICMDVQMPGMDGLEATRRLLHGEHGAPPFGGAIIALTAGSSHEEIDAALRAGMKAVLTKPLNEAQLLSVAHKLLHDAPRPHRAH